MAKGFTEEEGLAFEAFIAGFDAATAKFGLSRWHDDDKNDAFKEWWEEDD
jgi:hypothetical protein